MSEFKEELEDKLKKIKWYLRHRGCNTFEIMTNRNKYTGFVLDGSTIKNDRLFGKYKGCIVFNLNNCKIKYDDICGGMVAIISKKDGDKTFYMSFYNE